jgi:type I restriction enzyme R subunit
MAKGIHTEQTFEEAIELSLLSEGYEKGNADSFNRDLAIDKPTVLRFLQSSQPDQWKQLSEIHGSLTEEKIIERLCSELDQNGTLHVLRKGITDHGVKFALAFFKPESGLNPETEFLYKQNILQVTRQVHYNPKNENSIDMLLSLNGLPVATVELKNQFTGQNIGNAERQYKFDREATGIPLFRYTKRSLVHFAVDTDNVSMTTKLEGASTRFLPFNKGNNGGAGNTLNPSGYKTDYLWKEVWTKDSWMDILARFIHIEKIEVKVDTGEKREKISVIFPRYHQLDVVRKLASDAKANGAGKNYLIQHSAGSGKSNSIAWTAYRLSSLHNKKDERVFDSVIVITDRVVLDRQLQDTIFQFEHKTGVVQRIDENSQQLADALKAGKNIIITTLQKFPFIIDKIGELTTKNYALIVDEAHSSQGGETARKLKEALAAKTLEEAEAEEGQDTDPETYEDELRKQMQSRAGVQKNLSFFAFTATPKAKTLEVFGEKERGADGKPRPFHLYSMRQAIEERFILDVLKGYTTYKLFYKLSKEIEEDPQLNKKKAARAIGKFLSLHPHNLSQKVQIIIEHFKNVVSKKIGGKAKAMVVTSSRLHAVRYKEEFDRYIKENHYKGIKALVAFSGEVHDGGQTYTETEMNRTADGKSIGQKELPKLFDTPEYQVLIVADKYQTGFDQPLLHSMYVDKKLSGVRAVQTLSRLNRMCQGKEDTFVLDFVNDPEIIQESFQPYYEQTTLTETIDPNLLYKQKTEIESKQVIWQTEVDNFCKVFFQNKAKVSAPEQAKLNSTIDPAVDRFIALPSEEEKDNFENSCVSFRNAYSFLSQVMPFQDVELEKLYVYIRFMLKKLPQPNYTERLRLDEDVSLEYYRLQKITEGDIILAIQGETGIPPLSEAGVRGPKDEKAPLSEIISGINDRFGTDFNDTDRLFLDQIKEDSIKSEDIIQKALNNTLSNFELGYSDLFIDAVISRMEQNEIFSTKLIEEEVRKFVVKYQAKEIYDMIRKAHAV